MDAGCQNLYSVTSRFLSSYGNFKLAAEMYCSSVLNLTMRKIPCPVIRHPQDVWLEWDAAPCQSPNREISLPPTSRFTTTTHTPHLLHFSVCTLCGGKWTLLANLGTLSGYKVTKRGIWPRKGVTFHIPGWMNSNTAEFRREYRTVQAEIPPSHSLTSFQYLGCDVETLRQVANCAPPRRPLGLI